MKKADINTLSELKKITCIICHSERSEESRMHSLCVTEILPPYGRLNDK